MKKLIFTFLITFCLAGKALCFPALTGRVVDEANLLTYSQKEQLEQLLQQAEPHQVVAVSLISLEGKEIEEYGYQLGRHLGIGRKDINDGVLVLIAPNQRQLRIEVGYGLEGTLTDALCSRIVNGIMLPLARQGKYAEALIEGSQAVLKTLKGEELFISQTRQDNTTEKFFNILKICLSIFAGAIIFIIGVFLVILGQEPKTKKRKKSGLSNTKSNMKNKNMSVSKIEKKAENKSSIFWVKLVILGFCQLPFYIAGIICLCSGVFEGLWLVLVPLMMAFAFLMTPSRGMGNSKEHSFSHSDSFHSSHHSSFRGGGGSFGGGGSSGRW